MVWLGFELVGCTEDKFVRRAEIFQEKCEQPVTPPFQPASCAVLGESALPEPTGWRTDLLRRQSNQERMGPRVFSDEINALDLDIRPGIPPSELEEVEGVSAALGAALGIVTAPSHDRLGELARQVIQCPPVADVLIVTEGD